MVNIPSDNWQPSALENSILNHWPDGTLLLTEDGRCVDSNRLGRRICDRIAQETGSADSIPHEIWQTCRILIQSRRQFPHHLTTAESELSLRQSLDSFRIRAQWLNTGQGFDPHILVVLENQTIARQNLAKTEAIRYAFSPREADVWELHRIGYRYQEIAKKLHIAINTVKKHMKNTYAKQNVVSLVKEGYTNNFAS
ncbi:MAG: LuxR family transcriptional regulator [Symploca sp. SIO2G7]|nr:LuxR family transcriptional regulator [Symploca sp. SIO2G7]